MTPKLKNGIVQRGKTWSYVVRVEDPETGKSKPKWVGGFATERECKAARDEARVAARRGEYIDRNLITVRQYLLGWLSSHSLTVKPKSASGYRDDIECYILPRLGGMKLQAVRPTTISGLYAELLAEGGKDGGSLSASTVNHVHRTLRKALGDAVTVERLLPSNPAERAKVPRVTRHEVMNLWTPAQLQIFLSTAATHRLFAFYRLAAYTGARRGELLNLRWTDLDFNTAEVTFTGSTNVVQGERHEGTTKNDRSRVVSIDAETVEVMREHRRRQVTERLAAGPLWAGTDDLVFCGDDGSPLHPDTPSALMPKLVKKAGLPHARLHDLRHLHATTLLLAGVPVHVVANRLGHSDPSVTLRIYAHVLREQAAGVADVFAQAVAASR